MQKVSSVKSVSTEVAAWLLKFAKCYSAKNFDGVIQMLDLKKPLVFGSGPDEKCFTAAQVKKHIKRDFAQADKISMKIDWMKSDGDGNVAWFACEPELKVKSGKEKAELLFRFTGVLVKADNQWRLRMGQMGLIAVAQQEGESWPSCGCGSGCGCKD